MKLNRKPDEGFTLVELLIVVAIIGIIAAIAIPNLLSAIQRGRQKRSMGDLKTVATTIETYNTDNNTYPAGAGVFVAMAQNGGLYGNGVGFLDASYLPNPIFKDGWWTAANAAAVFWYERSAAGPPYGDYAICALGKDTKVDAGPAGYLCNGTAIADITAGPPAVTGVNTGMFDCDITIVDGQFMRQPIGKQANAPCA